MVQVVNILLQQAQENEYYITDHDMVYCTLSFVSKAVKKRLCTTGILNL